ncbi:MAG: hypothetical protein J6B32_00900 [Spirochaetaceae bacterium]|nr:hypothetical protein [Spirochaetaceae bacterium]
MKILYSVLMFLFILSPVFSDETEVVQDDHITFDENLLIDDKTGFPLIQEKPYIVFNEGLTTAWVTRIIKKENRSNFVFTDFMAGAYFAIETKNMQPLDSIIRFSVYYPISHKFNKVPQAKKNMLNFAFDLVAAPLLQMNMWEYVRINLGLGLHFLYQMGDRWNYINLGAACLAGVELPVAKRWTILLNGNGSWDFGNLGTNRDMEPYDSVWQYQLDLGVRYSRKSENKYSYIH